MNTVLSYVAGFIALLLVAALVGPTFVDWNRFRGEFEVQAQKMTGREVKIGGDISFVVLPAPHLTLNNVSIANVAAGENPDFMRLGRIDVEVALAPLLSGEIRATSIKIARPQIHLEVAQDGTNNWRNLLSSFQSGDSGFFAPSSVSLQKVSFEEGVVTLNDLHAARQWRIDHINGDVIATSLVGPMRAELNMSVNDIPLAVRVGLGSFANKKAFRITTEIQSLNVPAKFLFSGISTSISSDARIDGTATFEYGTTKTVEGEQPQAPLRVEAGIVTTGDSATFRNLIVGMAGTTLTGAAEVSLRGRPTASVTLKGEALTLDPLVDRLSGLMADDHVPLSGLVSLPVPGWIDADLSVSVDGVLSHDMLIKNAAIDLGLKDGALKIRQARGDIAGGSHVELSGDLTSGDIPQFAGKFSARGDNIAALALWLQSLRVEPVVANAGDGKASTDATDAGAVENVQNAAVVRAFAFSSQVLLTSDRLAFTDIKAAYAPTPAMANVMGLITFSAEDKRVRVSVDLGVTNFDVDPLRAFWPQGLDPKSVLADNDFDLTLKAQRLTIDKTEATGVDLAAKLDHGKLALDRFHVDDLAGATVDLAGALSGIPDLEIAALQGQLRGQLTADKIGPFLSEMGLGMSTVDGPADISLDLASGHAVDSDTPLDTLTIKGVLGAARVDAVLKRTHGDKGAADNINLIANAKNNDGRLLLRRLGVDADEKLAGAGSASLQMLGDVGKPYDTTFRLNVGEGTFTARGTMSDPFGQRYFVGRAEISASGLDTVMEALGAPDYVSHFAAAQADGPSFVFSSELDSQNGSLALRSIEVVTGNFRLTGDLAIAEDSATHLDKISGKLEANLVDLTPAFDDGQADASEKPGAFAWSASSIDWSPLSLATGDVDLKVGVLKVGTLQLNDASMHLALAEEVLSVTPFAATLADGTVGLTARIEGGKAGEPGIGLTFKLDGGDLSKLGPQMVGGSFAAGRISVDLRAEAQGRSWLALVSSADGVGTFSTRGFRFAPLDVAGYAKALDNMASIDELSGLSANVLAKGETAVDDVNGNLTIKDGLVQMQQGALALQGGKGKLKAMFDLPRLAVDSELDVSLTDPADAPGFSDVSSGRVGNLSRRLDTNALEQYAARRFLAKSAEQAGLKSLPKELGNLIGLPEKATQVVTSGTIPVPMPKPALQAVPAP
ncbi:MAG: AsmA family protein [Parvibaculum sp.]